MKYQPSLQPASQFGFNNIASAVGHAVDGLLNRIFALKHETAGLRSMVVSIGFILLWIIFAFTSRPIGEISNLIKTYLEVNKAGNPQVFLTSTASIIGTILFNLVVIRHLLALYVPFWLMKQVASIYLADIFEKEEKVAHNFIGQAAFGGTYETIYIRQGKVAAENEDSPMIQIGGPGYVVVELDSAVVFERPDGTARVIPEATKESSGPTLIQGFERIRQGLDLRDVIQKQDVASRSRDGIPVTAKDIQYSYSIYRGPNPVKSHQTPYPFDENAVTNLVYKATRSVKLNEPSEHKPDWIEPLPGKIIGGISAEMNGFINQRFLSDFLIAIDKTDGEGSQEDRKAATESVDIAQVQKENPAMQSGPAIIKATPEQAPSVNPAGQPTAPNQAEAKGSTLEFVPRSMLTKMFYESFQKKAPQGITLNWIGVGTWDTPAQAQIILKNHREAWKISRENFTRGNPNELQRISDEARKRELPRLIEEVLVRKFFVDLQGQSSENQIKAVLQEYLKALERSVELFRPDIPHEILDAIQEINRWLYPEHHTL